MNAGHFRKNHVSTGDLNRPRSPEVRKPLVCFLVLFAQRKKNKPAPFRELSRFCKPRFSPPQPQLRTATIKTFLRGFRGSANLEPAYRSCNFPLQQLKPFLGSSEVLQTSKQHTQTTNSCNPIKSFRRPQRHPFGGLRRTKTCHRQLFARQSSFFLLFAKSRKKLWHFLPKCDILQKIP